MDGDIINLVTRIPERENAGSRTQNRFNYQNHWAICHLLELHEKGVDFILAVECHDDVLEILPGSSKQLNFYQIKTTKGNISVNPGNRETMSYIGRMLCHLSDFGEDNVGTLTVISNRAFKTKTGKGATHEFENKRLSDFQEDVSQEIWNAATETISDPETIEKVKTGNFIPDILVFKVSDLSLDNFIETTKGKIISILEKHKKDQVAIPFYKALLAEINRQVNREKGTLGQMDFLQDRSISKKCFDEMIKEVIEQPLMKERVESILRELETSCVTWAIRAQYKKTLRTLEVDIYSKSSYYQLLSGTISTAYKKIDVTAMNFNEIIEEIFSSIKNEELVREIIRQKSEMYVKANIALRINE